MLAPALAGLLLTPWACAPEADAPDDFASVEVTTGAAVRSARGVVVAGHPLAARAGAFMLEQGGNAVDAAVAAAFALAVVEPSMSGLGGRTQILIRTPDGAHHGIDGTTQAPASYDPDTAPQASYGYATIGVPGVPAGLLRALEEHGSLPRGTVMQPAILYAEEGFELLPGEAGRHAAAAERLGEFEGSRAVFLKEDGTPWAAGERFVQPDLARTLRQIADGGVDAFYRGAIAEAMARDVQAQGGALTLESLASYRAEASTVVVDDYRGLDLFGLWIPSFGAITIEVLNLMETLPMGELDEAHWAVALSEAIRIGYLDRPRQEGPDDAARLTSDAYALERASLMRLPEGMASMQASSRGRADGSDAAVSASMADPPATATGTPFTLPGARTDTRARPAGWTPPPAWSAEPGHTTHLTAADADGTVVALTQSLGPSMGSTVATPGLGFLYAATLGGYLGRMEPGERARSHISPFMVERDGEPFLALGAAGGGRIPTAIVAAVSRVVDRDMSLQDALQAPRIVPEYTNQYREGDADAPAEVTVETRTGLGFAPEVLARLRALGYAVEEEPRAGRFGRVHAVRWHAGALEWEGVADPDWEGAAAAPGGEPRDGSEGRR
jgi:gamma-glutamyltranspeptidase/glutathione hydrolase